MKFDSRSRRFVSLTRTMSPDGRYSVLDAIDNEGNAWWLIAAEDDLVVPDDWSPLTPLPQS